MRLSWNEIRLRASQFSKEWKDEGYEKGQTQLFYRDFFDIFGVPIRRIASFEEPVRKLGDKRGYIDLFWKGVLLVEQKSIGLDLAKAKTQALDYFPGLKDTELPRFILLSDFQHFELYDLDESEAIAFELKDLAKNVEHFGFILGVQKRTFKDQDPVNIKAAELVGKLHDALEESGYVATDLEVFLVRIVFCLFADDTSIFEPRGMFLDILTDRTSPDGSDLGAWLSRIFQVLDTSAEKRSTVLDEDLAQFPYINGRLFQSATRIPEFNAAMRELLINASLFDWSLISPAIFGSLFQSVMEKEERRSLGAHYTTEKNILKVIQPLFLDELWSRFESIKSRNDSRRKKALQQLQFDLGSLTFFDPACGCGNFLIISYREIRILEMEILRELISYQRDHEGMFSGKLDSAELSMVDVDQFYGIEIGEFASKIAQTALWMMDHILNNLLSLEFGQFFSRIPLTSTPNILCEDALEIDWNPILPPNGCSFIFGNPPFIGAKYQTAEQRAQVRNVAKLGNSGGTLDYVCSWFIRACEYACQLEKTLDNPQVPKIAFVSTNSIVQGEQVAQFWPIIFKRNDFEISFAHRTFAWGSDARGKAHVHVVIVGLDKASNGPKSRLLFYYDNINGDPHVDVAKSISPYLLNADKLSDPHILVKEESRPLNGLPRIRIGSKPIDGGNYIFSKEEKVDFLSTEPSALKFMHPFVGAKEFLNGGERFILFLGEASPSELREMPFVRDRVSKVREFRLESKSPGTNSLADSPTDFHVTVVPKKPFLVIPESSSERREYLPIGWLEPPTIPSNLVRILEGASLEVFGLLTSKMHMAWLRTIGGRLKSDYRYSIGLVYNTFPIPDVSATKWGNVATLANNVLVERSKYSTQSLSDLYDPDFMPISLRKAHRNLDRAVDLLYTNKKMESENDRVNLLLELYKSNSLA